MMAITVNIDQAVKRQAEAVLAVYGQSMEEVIGTFLSNIAQTGQIPQPIEETNPLYGEEISGEFDWFDETEEEFFAKLEQAERNFDAGLGIPIEEFFDNFFQKHGIQENQENQEIQEIQEISHEKIQNYK